MLFVLTGDIQIGKTRWLQRLTEGLADRGVPVAGVLAPGVWRANPACANGLEKVGIDNVLLPGGERVAFARRRDLAVADGTLEYGGQSEREGLGWAMSDASIARVDAHFARLAAAPAPRRPGLLVVDELGRLELALGEGLAHAVGLLAAGPRPGWLHALVVVRDLLLPLAHERLDDAWPDGVREIAPTADARAELLGLYA